jgi:hypothetical protein
MQNAAVHHPLQDATVLIEFRSQGVAVQFRSPLFGIAIAEKQSLFDRITRYDFVRQVAGATVLDLQFVNR